MTMDRWLVVGAAVAFSVVRGVYAVRIFDVAEPEKNVWSWRVHQFWFNFVGALAGCAALAGLRPAKWLEGTTPDVNGGSVALAVVAFAGITGYLPALFWRLLESVARLMAWGQALVEKSLPRGP